MQAKLETRSCPICHSPNYALLYTVPAGTFNRAIQGVAQATIVRCQSCKLLFTNPVLNENLDNEQYTHKRSGYNKREISSIRDIYWSDQEICLYELLSWKNVYSMNILDFACGKGGFVYLAQKSGIQVKGIDLNEKGIQIGIRHGVQNISCAMVQDEPSQQYHIVTALHALEHMQDCQDIVREFHRILKPEGHLVLATPNFTSLSFRIKPKNYWNSPYSHMNALTIGALDKLCLPYGFKRMRLKGAFMQPSKLGLKLSLSMCMTKYLGNCINFYPTKLFVVYQKLAA